MKEGSSTGSKRLIVLRHAKAERGAYIDFERPLTGRGRKDALAVGRWLAESELRPDLTVCSPATRAKETWALAAVELGDGIPTSYERALYGADIDETLAVVRDTPDDVRTLCLVGHNPGLQEFVLAMAGEGDPDLLRMTRTDFGTAAIAVLEVEGNWSVLSESAGRLAAFVIARG
jgi:phosphohistidine phosphatase